MDAKSPSSNRPPGFHRLPQIPMMGRNVRTAQSKSSARQAMESKVLTASDEVDNLNIVNLWTKTDSKVVKSMDVSNDIVDIENCTTPIASDEAKLFGTATVTEKTEIKGTPAGTLISTGELTEKRKRRSSKKFEMDTAEEKTFIIHKKQGRKSKDVAKDSVSNDKKIQKQSRRKSKTDTLSSLPAEENIFTNEIRKTQSPLEKKKSRSKLEIEARAIVQLNTVELMSEPATAGQGVGTTDDSHFESQDEDMEIGIHIPRCVIITPPEVPSEAEINQMFEQPSVISDLEHPILWNYGDMLWGKVSGHPYWPCMVSPCPFTKMLTRVKVLGKPIRLYHVQYFGDDCERGWVRETSLMVYKGKDHFFELAKSSKAAKATKYGRGNNPFKVNPSRHDWRMSVEEAENAFMLNEKERIVQYSFDYLFLEKNIKKKQTVQSTPVQRKRKKSLSLSPDESRAKKRKIEVRGIPLNSQPETNDQEDLPDVYDFDHHQSTSTVNPPVTGKRSKKPTIKLVESILQASPGAKKSASPVNKKERLRKISLPEKMVTINAEEEMATVFTAAAASTLSPCIHLSPFKASPRRMRGRPRKIPQPEAATAEIIIVGEKETEENNLSSDAISGHVSVSCPTEVSPRKNRPRKIPHPGAAIAESTNKEEKTIEETFLPSDCQVTASCQTETPAPSQPAKRQRLRKSSQTSKESSNSPSTNADETDNSSPKYSLVPETLLARKSSQDSDSTCSENKPKKIKENEPYELEVYKLQSTTKIEKEHICAKCENNGELIECHGSCCQYFHPKCLMAVPTNIEEFKCEECTSGIHPCFACKITDQSTKKCSVHQCGKFYHEQCVQRLRLTRIIGDNKAFICPLHACLTCAVDNIKNIKATKGRLFRCIRCPTAYHHGDFCIAAGSQVLGGGFIICSDHFQPNKSQSSHAHFNINWCFICNRGGALLCCESCPASYHPDCIKVEKTPDEAWFCEECHAGRKPLYGNIVWIKVGNYRWWPGEVCHPRHVPHNIQEKAHQVGEFPVRFFGSHDYYWIHKGRVFLFEEGDKASRDSSSKNLYKIYSKGVQEATEAFSHWKAVMERKEEQEQERSFKKPSTFKFIKRNFPVGSVQINLAELSEIPRCECKEEQEEPCSSDCLNRMMMYECHPQVCPAKDKCHNQRFQKRLYPECEPFKSEGRGWGLRTVQDLRKGQFVMEYVGDLIDEEECKKRIEIAHENNITNFYMLTMDKNRIIDAGPRGNNSRFMNHSCCPNLVTQKWMVNGDIRVGLFTLCDIPKGTELTFNYNLECLGNEKTACACGADNCSGFLGVRPKTAAAIANEKKMKEMKKKKQKKKITQKKETEDECFRCGEGGELVMCDKGNCPKVYHLQCLKLNKPPTGKWSCPWHHCDDCGKAATSLCSECPNSFCPAHIEGNIVSVNGCLVCTDHEEDNDESSPSVNMSSNLHNMGTQADESTSDNSDEDTSQEESSIQRALFKDATDNNKVKKNGDSVQSNGKKVAKRKSFKDILNEASPVKLNNVSSNSASISSGSQKVKKLKGLPNGNCVINGNGEKKDISPPPNGQGEKIGIFLKKTTVSSKKGGKSGQTKTRYKSQLLSSPHKYMLSGGQEENEDNDSESDLVIDIS